MRAGTIGLTIWTILGIVAAGCSGGSSSRARAGSTTAPALLNAVSPASGVVDGGTRVTLTGANFDGATEVRFGTNAAARVTVLGSFTAVAVAPRGTAGTVNVTVRNSLGTPATLNSAFTYTAAPAGAEIGDIALASGPATGGAVVTIRGWNLSGATTVRVGGSSATGVAATTPSGLFPTAITATTPAGPAGDADVEVTNPDGTSAALVNGYAYLGAPVITGASSGALDPAGGTPVVISGTGFNAPAAVLFGATSATATIALTSQQIIAWAPAGPAGATVSITVTNPDGQPATLGAAVSYASSVTSPTVSTISASSGPAAGGALLTINGSGFVSGAAVWIGAGPCSSVNVVSGNQLTALSPRVPAATNGAQSVVVVNADGGTGTLASAFTYDAMTLPAPAGIVQEPDVVIDGGGTIHTVWNTPTGVGTNSDVWYSRSTDGGRTWSAAAVPAGCG